MSVVKNKILNAVVISIAVFVIVHITIAFLYGVVMIYLFFIHESVVQTYVLFISLCMFFGYAVYSLWWLVFSYRKLKTSRIPIPIPIKFGLSTVVLTIRGFMLMESLFVGLGSLLVVVIMLTMIYSKQRNNA